MNIVVLCAGTSTEREVSIVSGHMVCKALRDKGNNARVLDIYFGTDDRTDVNSDNFFEGEYDLEKEVELISSYTKKIPEYQAGDKAFFGNNVVEICKTADVVFMALHGQNGEDGKVQAVFDLFGIKYTGTGYIGSALAMDKGLAKSMFIAENVPTPKGFVLHKGLELQAYTESLNNANINVPFVVKPCCGGSSIGVTIVRDMKDFEVALKTAFDLENAILVEEYIAGREVSIGVIDGKALPIIEIIPKEGFYDYENKYKPGATTDVCPAELPDHVTEKLQREAEHAARALRLETYSRIDFLIDKDENIYCLEANTLPGMTPTSLLPQEAKVMGIDYPELCELLIKKSL